VKHEKAYYLRLGPHFDLSAGVSAHRDSGDERSEHCVFRATDQEANAASKADATGASQIADGRAHGPDVYVVV
jgi:hypothetical protein